MGVTSDFRLEALLRNLRANLGENKMARKERVDFDNVLPMVAFRKLLRGQSKYAKQYCEEHLQEHDTTKENTPAVFQDWL